MKLSVRIDNCLHRPRSYRTYKTSSHLCVSWNSELTLIFVFQFKFQFLLFDYSFSTCFAFNSRIWTLNIFVHRNWYRVRPAIGNTAQRKQHHQVETHRKYTCKHVASFVSANKWLNYVYVCVCGERMSASINLGGTKWCGRMFAGRATSILSIFDFRWTLSWPERGIFAILKMLFLNLHPF